ncbi:MAG: stage III sporulation protein AF [Ruminiclostridium sp.]|nr:stage III sporulation protein AF [Ruminiclostridium sp.]
MLRFLNDWILNITALVLFLAVIEILMPSGRMKKYCGLVTGVILIIAIINPFLKLFSSDFNLEDIQVANSNTIDRLEIEKNSKLLKDDQMKLITEVYRKKIIGQLEESAKKSKGVAVVKGDVIINEDYNSESFGEVKRVYLEITTSEVDNNIKPVVKVRQVKIGEDKLEETGSSDVDPKLKKQLEDRIISLFGLNRDIIVISKSKK